MLLFSYTLTDMYLAILCACKCNLWQTSYVKCLFERIKFKINNLKVNTMEGEA